MPPLKAVWGRLAETTFWAVNSEMYHSVWPIPPLTMVITTFDWQIMSSQPQVENLVKRFVWAQLDRHHKRLYYVYSEVNISTDFYRFTFPTVQSR